MTRPTWQDFATHDESAYPELWDGVVGAWAPCLGPTGSRLHDHSRRSNWGTLTNMDPPTDWVVSDGQYALDLDGSNNYVFPEGNWNQFQDVTLSLWVKFTSTAFASIIASRFASGGAVLPWAINTNINGTGGISFWGSNNNTSDLNSASAFNSGRWVLATATRGVGSGIRIYKDGVLDASTTYIAGANQPNARMSIGRIGDFNGLYWAGRFDDALIWNRALSPNEIRQLYQLGRGGMYQRRRRSRMYISQAGFQAAWARRQSQIIGGGL